MDLELHWNKAYENTQTEKLGWYEEYPEPSLQLIKKCNLNKDSILLNVGVGATTLIDELVILGYKNIIGTDLSSTAVEKIKQRIGSVGHDVKWIIDDLTNSKKLIYLPHIDLWHDRAVLHFFNDRKDQDAYFNNIVSNYICYFNRRQALCFKGNSNDCYFFIKFYPRKGVGHTQYIVIGRFNNFINKSTKLI